jgi:hypothetical protein
MAMIGNTAFASVGANVFSTTNGGATWTPGNGFIERNGGQGLTGSFKLATNGSNIHAVGFDVFTSANTGVLWRKVTTNIQNWLVQALTTNGSTLYAAGFIMPSTASTNIPNKVWMSTNNGSTWTQIFDTNFAITSIAASGENIYVGTNGALYLSKNGGVTWANVSNGIDRNIESIVIKDKTVFVATNLNIYYSKNDGITWRSAREGLPIRTSAYELNVGGNYLFAGTSTGIFRRPLSEFISTHIKENKEEFNCSISPNPASNLLTIKVSDNLIGKKYTINNILGETIKADILTNNSTELNVNNLANGIYFLHLIGTNKTVKFVKE